MVLTCQWCGAREVRFDGARYCQECADAMRGGRPMPKRGGYRPQLTASVSYDDWKTNNPDDQEF